MDLHPTVSIVGAGPAGFALAADLQSRGTSVLLYSHPTRRRHADHVESNGHLRASGILEGSTELRVTSDMAEIVAFSLVIILTVPSTGQETVLQELKKFDLRKYAIIAIPGNLFSLIADMEVGCVFETNLSPYSCRMEQGGLTVMGKKELIFIAALQRDLDPAVYETIESIFPTELKWCSSIIEVCLSNVNGVFHPLMMLMNAGRIESTAGDFLLYRDGLTPAVANAMVAIDRVRIAIGEAFGLSLKSSVDISNECYGQSFTDFVDLAQNSPPHNRLMAPSDIQNRNISEDVPDLLVPWCCLAEKLEIDASPIKAVIMLAEMTTGVNYMETGRNLQRLHLENVSREELIERFSPVLGKLVNSTLSTSRL
ncbi:6-phosphogluconate dehydrogenase C-terminal domain-like protein [Lentithecium fluviatile CBS 122367]|uniref:6-phosphogluconate dehydrogenase C-terminal domain-like protein n=1 Tax=Lentithecium fluviatile CBS 122367 TaxID=1168545 RepID=A0A6G1JNI5_9PLEO|nr:6-phosphogluconate dehydrogenase C-terminal domain-like protein [Lentithecium fluviatile CBS 122367]